MIKLELKKLKVSRSLSEETLAFTADVWLGGKKVGYASERGTGGQVNFLLNEPSDRVVVAAYETELKTLPPKLFIEGDTSLDIQPRSIEDAINHLAWDMDHAKEVRSKLSRAMKTSTAFLDPAKEVHIIKALGPKIEAHIFQKWPGSTILNAMSLDDAVALCLPHL